MSLYVVMHLATPRSLCVFQGPEYFGNIRVHPECENAEVLKVKHAETVLSFIEMDVLRRNFGSDLMRVKSMNERKFPYLAKLASI